MDKKVLEIYDKVKDQLPEKIFLEKFNLLKEEYDDLDFMDDESIARMAIGTLLDEDLNSQSTDFGESVLIESSIIDELESEEKFEEILKEILEVYYSDIKFSKKVSENNFIYTCFRFRDNCELGNLKHKFYIDSLLSIDSLDLPSCWTFYSTIVKYSIIEDINFYVASANFSIVYKFDSSNNQTVSFVYPKDLGLFDSDKSFESVKEFADFYELKDIKLPNGKSLEELYFDISREIPEELYELDSNYEDYLYERKVSDGRYDIDITRSSEDGVEAIYVPFSGVSNGTTRDYYDMDDVDEYLILNDLKIAVFKEDPVSELISALKPFKGKYAYVDYILKYVNEYPNDYTSAGELFKLVEDLNKIYNNDKSNEGGL